MMFKIEFDSTNKVVYISRCESLVKAVILASRAYTELEIKSAIRTNEASTTSKENVFILDAQSTLAKSFLKQKKAGTNE